MPIKQAAWKYLKQSQKRALRNEKAQSRLQYLMRMARKSFEEKNTAKASELVKTTVKAIDKAAQKGILKHNTASRKKSLLMRHLHLLHP